VLKREAEVYGARPKVEIKCDFSYTLSLPASKVDRDIVTVPEAFAGAAVAPVKALARAVGAAPEEEGKNAITEFPVLQDVQCAFRPGEITLVLAPPGHGKTALLKAVAGCLPAGRWTRICRSLPCARRLRFRTTTRARPRPTRRRGARFTRTSSRR
jgi:ABC-type glutathione transport system ATPase component